MQDHFFNLPQISNFKMEKIFRLSLLVLLMCTINCFAQPGAVKKASKAEFILTTYKADGSILATCKGIFVSQDGIAISPWAPFVGAQRAVVTTADNKTLDVKSIIGANELYDVAQFKVDGQTSKVKVSNEPVPENAKLWLQNNVDGKTSFEEVNVLRQEVFMEKYKFLVLSTNSDQNIEGCPLYDNKGNVIALLQKNGHEANAVSAQFVADIKTTALAFNNSVLAQTSIAIALPVDLKEATLALLLSSQQNDTIKYKNTINQFISMFPNIPDGYQAMAQYEMNTNNFADADINMAKVLEVSDKKDEAHFSYGKLIYQKMLYKSDYNYPAWTLDKAMNEIKKAYSINPLPIYKQVEGQIYYTQAKYQDAYDIFMGLTKTNIRNADLFYEAAQSKQQLKADDKEILALLDSAISVCKKPYSPESATYFFARASQYANMGLYRKAVQDFNQYDTLCYGRHNADFYYIREQSEVKGKLFKQALDDINRAIILAPQEPLYYAEKANLQLKVNQQYECIATAMTCINIAPEYPDIYLILGLAQIQTGQKKEGLQSLDKAKKLGNTQAQQFIDRYKK